MEEQGQKASGKGGIGCGPMIAFLIILVILLVIGGNAALGYYFKHCGGEEPFNCLMGRLEEPESEGAVTATGTYSYKDYSVQVTANIPLEGGAVTGTVTGTCEGKLKGSFDGKNNGGFSGTMTGACSPFFVNIPAGAKFGGTVNKDAKNAPINFTGSGGGMSHEDSMTLTY